jgi:hypothetical protein
LNKRWWRWVPGTKVGTELEFHTYREVGVRINDPPGQWSKLPHPSLPPPTRKQDLLSLYIKGKDILRDCGLLEASEAQLQATEQQTGYKRFVPTY